MLVADDASLAHNLAEPAAALLADVQRRRAMRLAPHSCDTPCCVTGMELVVTEHWSLVGRASPCSPASTHVMKWMRDEHDT